MKKDALEKISKIVNELEWFAYNAQGTNLTKMHYGKESYNEVSNPRDPRIISDLSY